jgi:hypothetical protein
MHWFALGYLIIFRRFAGLVSLSETSTFFEIAQQVSMSQLSIYFHKDFDGLVAAALFLQINEESQLIGAESVSLKALDYDIKDKWLKTVLPKPNVVIDFLYHPKAEWWFDHHVSTFLNENHKEKYHNSKKQFWDVSSPSCAALIRTNLESQCSLFLGNGEYQRIVDRFREWIYWSDVIDNAKYENPSQVVELKEPCLQINATLTHEVSEEYLSHLIFAAKMYSPEDVLQTKAVYDKVQKVLFLQNDYLDLFKKSYKIFPQKTVFFDYVAKEMPFQRYFTYYFEPEAFYSIGLYKRNGGYGISVGKNPWMNFTSKNIGEICKEYGGGGRLNVGSILLNDYNSALEVVAIICQSLSTQDLI